MSSTSGDDEVEAKTRLRERMARRRRELHERERALRSARVVEQVVATPEWSAAEVVGFYVSVDAEVETRRAIAAALGGKRVAAPRVDPEAGAMDFAALEDLEDLEEGPLGVPEPTGSPVDPGDLDLVLVPGLAFDEAGNRLGRGGGYYDRFLARCPAWSCGLAFGFQLVDRVPVDGGDVPVDAVATEHRVHRPDREG